MKKKQTCNWDDVIKEIEARHPNITVPKEQEYVNTTIKINYLKANKEIKTRNPDITIPKDQGYIYTGPKLNWPNVIKDIEAIHNK